MRIALAMIAVLGLVACASDSGPDGGVANYDALKSAHDKCATQGGKLVLKDQGNGRDISAYVCKRT
jgi:putative hemolysin